MTGKNEKGAGALNRVKKFLRKAPAPFRVPIQRRIKRRVTVLFGFQTFYRVFHSGANGLSTHGK